MPRAAANRRHPKRGKSPRQSEGLEKCSRRRRCPFKSILPIFDGKSGKKPLGRRTRRWPRYSSVILVATPQRNGGAGCHSIDPKMEKTRAKTGDVGQRIDSRQLVKTNSLPMEAMDACLRVSQYPEDAQHLSSQGSGRSGSSDKFHQRENFPRQTEGVRFLRNNPSPGPDSPSRKRESSHLHSFQTKTVKGSPHMGDRQSQIDKGSDKHIPGKSRRRIHRQDHSAAMIPAKYPAPKPLSMLTTATPGEQLFNIVKRGATPRKEAP